MAKKKAAKKTAVKSKAKPAKKMAAKKKAKAKAAARPAKKVARARKPAKKAVRSKVTKKAATKARKARPKAARPAPGPKAAQPVEKMTVEVTAPDKSGDLVATESLGGDVKVHHTVHQGDKVTPIPGRSYSDLKKLGEGTHEIEVARPAAPVPAATAPAE